MRAVAKGLDVSEKRDLWVPAVLALGGVALFVWNLGAGSAVPGVLALLVGLAAAIACLPLRLKQSQARVVGFGTGVALVLMPTVPGVGTNAASALAWVVVGLAFVWPARCLPLRVRMAMLAAAALFAILGVLAAAGLLPKSLVWLFLAAAGHLAAQIVSARPRAEPAPPPGPRVGLMGGSFDPFHVGHRALAEGALKVVDRLLVVPVGRAPHKREAGETTAFHHRVAMARLGVEGLARTEVLELEGRRSGPSYTVDTLDVLRSSHPAGTRFLLLLGADMYQDLPNWKDWERLVSYVTLLVAARPGCDLDPPPEFEGLNVVVERLRAPLCDVSSTQLRDDIAAGRAVGDHISPAVRAYLRDHVLYREEDAREDAEE